MFNPFLKNRPTLWTIASWQALRSICLVSVFEIQTMQENVYILIHFPEESSPPEHTVEAL